MTTLFLRLLTSLLQSPRVSLRHKVQRMYLADAKYLGLMHLRVKRLSPDQPLESEPEVGAFFDLMAIFDDSATYQGRLFD